MSLMKRLLAFARNGYLPLAAVCLIGFFLVSEPFFNRTFYTEKPNNLLASDAYEHLLYVESIRDVGNYNYEPGEMVAFVKERLTPREPPLQMYYSAFLGNLLGIPSYVAAQFGLLLALFAAFSSVYILLARYDFRLAAVVSPFFLLSFNFPFIAGITWGFWKVYFSALLFFFSLLLFPVKFRGGALFLWALLLGAIFVSHPTLLIYGILVLLLRFLLYGEDRGRSGLLKFVAIGMAAAALSSVYLLDFIASRNVSGGTQDSGILEYLKAERGYNIMGPSTPLAGHFGYLWYLALLGFGLAVFFAFRLRREKNYFFRVLVLLSFVFAILAAGPSFFGRVYQFRLVWPVIAAVFLGFPVYVLLKSLPPIKGKTWPYLAVFLLSLYLLFALNALNPSQGDYSILSGEQWAAYRFVAEKTPKDAKVLVVDPTLTQGAVLFNTRRYTRHLDGWMFDEIVRDGTEVADKETGIVCSPPENIRKGFSIVPNNVTKAACERKNTSICEFDYILTTLQVKREAEVGLLNRFFASLDPARYEVAYKGKQAIVLRNREVCRDGA